MQSGTALLNLLKPFTEPADLPAVNLASNIDHQRENTCTRIALHIEPTFAQSVHNIMLHMLSAGFDCPSIRFIRVNDLLTDCACAQHVRFTTRVPAHQAFTAWLVLRCNFPVAIQQKECLHECFEDPVFNSSPHLKWHTQY
jgi:hypothetical protein